MKYSPFANDIIYWFVANVRNSKDLLQPFICCRPSQRSKTLGETKMESGRMLLHGACVWANCATSLVYVDPQHNNTCCCNNELTAPQMFYNVLSLLLDTVT